MLKGFFSFLQHLILVHVRFKSQFPAVSMSSPKPEINKWKWKIQWNAGKNIIKYLTFVLSCIPFQCNTCKKCPIRHSGILSAGRWMKFQSPADWKMHLWLFPTPWSSTASNNSSRSNTRFVNATSQSQRHPPYTAKPMKPPRMTTPQLYTIQ